MSKRDENKLRTIFLAEELKAGNIPKTLFGSIMGVFRNTGRGFKQALSIIDTLLSVDKPSETRTAQERFDLFKKSRK